LLYLALATVFVILSAAPKEIRFPLPCLFTPATFDTEVAFPAAEFRMALALAMPRLVFSLGFGTTTAEVPCEDGAPLDFTVAVVT
jgi:hypothetical protein